MSCDGTARRRLAVQRRARGRRLDDDLVSDRAPDVKFALKGNGAVSWAAIENDGTATVSLTGHNVVFYFPTDTLLGGTPGPATLLIAGREVFGVDAAGNFTQLGESGNVTDICAQLPPD